ncbi:hypothetical protein CBM2606_A10055 [Cupriavidus taiwanensis]|nr:hypothetical protein CBM2606_A10055 [Cupriavidus taiwanensis]
MVRQTLSEKLPPAIAAPLIYAVDRCNGL